MNFFQIFMNQEIIKNLVNCWRTAFFTEPILLLFLIFSFTLGLFYHRKERIRILFLIYFFIGIALFVAIDVAFVFRLFEKRAMAVFQEISNTIFALFEFITFYCFFKECLQTEKFKRIFGPSFLLFLVATAIFLSGLVFFRFSVDQIRKYSLYVSAFEFLFLSGMCLFYFYELFAKIPKATLFRRPSFLIVTTTFFYAVLPIPFFMLAMDMIFSNIYNILAASHYLLFMLMLVSISKAFLWKTPITT